MKCYNEVCPNCRKSLKEDKRLKDGKLVTVFLCEKCNIEYDKKPHLVCGSRQFITPESHKQRNDHVNLRLIICVNCGQGYSTVEKIVNKADYSGYLTLLNKYNENYDLFENEGKE